MGVVVGEEKQAKQLGASKQAGTGGAGSKREENR